MEIHTQSKYFIQQVGFGFIFKFWFELMKLYFALKTVTHF